MTYTDVNALVTEFCLSYIFEIYSKIGSYRLPTHKRSAHRKFYQYSLLIWKLKFWPNNPILVTLGTKKNFDNVLR